MSTNSSDIRTNRLVFTSLMTCLVLLGTLLFRIPVPMTQGYVHLGDAMIYIAVFILGKKQGAVAAALGSSLGDVLGGFAFWAPWSFIIKFAMAYACGSLTEKTSKIAAMTAGGLIMCAGYLIAERIMYGSWALAAIGLPWNAGQFAVGIVVSLAAQPLLNFIPSPKNRSM
ncbi:MAG: ECF transporter S component [Firmicutes bacterium]|nr:ECF transporter S component [Bacillota bacterium]